MGRLLGRPRVRVLRLVLILDRGAGGQLLAAGLAFRALFALLPGLLLMVGLLGIAVADPRVRADLLTRLLAVLPGPLVEAVGGTLQDLVAGRGAYSLLGLVGLAWGASGFYVSLDTAMARLVPGPRHRGAVEERIRGLLAILLVGGAVLGLVLAGIAWSVVEAGLSRGVGGDYRLVAALLSWPAFVLAVWASYRLIPTDPPSKRAALLPALAAGTGVAIVTDLFTLLAPWLVGALSAFGLLVTLLAMLAWLGYAARLVVLGATWARVRRDLERGLSPALLRSGGRSAPSPRGAARS